jgi:hypothetical protein
MKRILRGVLLVSGVGAMSGYLLGVLLTIGVAAVRLEVPNIPVMLLASGPLGALAGAILAPLLGFVFLRHIPLWRSILWTSLGTILGWISAIATGQFWWILGGFVGAGLALRFVTPPGPAAAALPENAASGRFDMDSAALPLPRE